MPRPPWAVLIYVGASEPHVHGFVEDNLREIEQARFRVKLPIAVQIDWGVVGQRMVITEKGRRIVSRPKVFDSGKEAVLRAFLRWGRRKFGAERHMLVLLGHGLGVGHVPEAARSSTNSSHGPSSGLAMLYDGKQWLSIESVARTLRTVWHDKRLDVLGFNSCFMNATEIAYELRDSVRYVVGSQAQMAMPGWAYRTVMSRMARRPTIHPATVCRVIVSATARKHARSDLAVVMSALDLDRANGMARSIKDLVVHLQAAVSKPAEHRRIQSAIFGAHYDSLVRDFPDLWGFCRRLAKYSRHRELRTAARSAALAVRYGEQAIVYWKKDFRSRYNVDMGGLSIYFEALPESKPGDVQVDREGYERLSFCRYTGWDKFMYGFRWWR